MFGEVILRHVRHGKVHVDILGSYSISIWAIVKVNVIVLIESIIRHWPPQWIFASPQVWRGLKPWKSRCNQRIQ